MSDERTALQEHIYHLMEACFHVIASADVVFQDASKLNEFKPRLPDMLQDIHKAAHVVLAHQVPDDGERR